MSLHPLPPAAVVPDDTATVARRVFRKGNDYLRLRDALGPLFADASFVSLYHHPGAPAISPARLAIVSILQFREGLTDEQAADAVRSRIDWKYLLGLPLADDGFDFSVLSEFRDRLIAGSAELLLLERLLAVCREQGMLRARGQQRTDSTHVLGTIRHLSRLELVRETLRAALEALAVAAPDWLRRVSDPAWVERYAERSVAARLPKSEPQRRALAEVIGQDGQQVLSAIDTETAAPQSACPWLGTLPAVRMLRTVWEQQYQQTTQGLRWRRAGDLPPASEGIVSPYDPDVRYGQKRELEWEGAKVHLTETCDPDLPHLITDVQTTPPSTADCTMLDTIQADLEVRQVPPGSQFVDAGYVDAGRLVASRETHGIDLVGPLEADTSWQARTEGGLPSSAFTIEWEARTVRCPQGKTSSTWRAMTDTRSNPAIQVHFRRTDCQACPVRERCTRADRRSLTLLPQPHHEARQAALARQDTDAFREAYRIRAGVEGTISDGVRCHDLRRARYRGLPKLRLQHILSACAIDLERVAAWLDHRPRTRTRTSHFAHVMALAA